MRRARFRDAVSRWRRLARSFLVILAIGAASHSARVCAQARTLGAPHTASVADRTPQRSAASSESRATSDAADTPSLARALGSPSSDPRRAAPDVALDLTATVRTPISIGIDATLTLPYGIMFTAHGGMTPDGFVELLNEIVLSLDGYGQDTAALVRRTGGGAFVLGLEAGLRPFREWGFEAHVGYTAIFASTRIDRASFAAATGQVLPPVVDSVGVSATLHALTLRVGWREVLFDHLVVAGSIGWAHTVAADASLDVPGAMRERMQIDRYEASIASAITRWGFTPEVRVTLGYRF